MVNKPFKSIPGTSSFSRSSRLETTETDEPGIFESDEPGMAALDQHRNDIAMIISAPYEFETFFPSDQLDTFIWLHVPNAHSSVKMACTGICFQSSWLLPYSSAALRNSGFSKFAQLLDNPQYQKRTRNRMSANGILPVCDNLKTKRLYLDLGPSDDSELHAEHLEALTLPRGIIRYSTMVDNGEESVPRSCAGGHDDACRCFQLALGKAASANLVPGPEGKAECEQDEEEIKGDKTTAPDTDAEDGQANTPVMETQGEAHTAAPARDGENDVDQGEAAPTQRYETGLNGPKLHSVWDGELKPEYQIDDYCEIRHICNVIRLLMAIAGHRLFLNSAARVYTLAGLAKLFTLVSSDGYYDGELQMYADHATFANNFRSMVSEWFFKPKNAAIIDILPEECLIIAWNLKLAPVARCAFRILVAETALLDTLDNGAKPRTPQARRITAFGRELSGLLDDDMENIVEHASGELIQRLLKLRDATTEKISTLATHTQTRRPVGDGADTEAPYNFAKDPFFSQAKEGVLANLVKVSDTLETFAFAEQTILSNCPLLPFLPTVKKPVQAAFEAVQGLLRHLAVRVVKSYRGTSAESRANFPAMHAQSMKRYIDLYRRKGLNDSPTWLLYAYKRLSDDQKCMTSLYWKSLWEYSSARSYQETREALYADLLEAADTTILDAVTRDIETAKMGRTTESLLRDMQRDLLFRLQGIGLLTDLVHGNTADFFSFVKMTNALTSLVSEPFIPLHDRTYFSPKIEIDTLQPSPHLMLCLTSDEFRFLPMWAGGNNDDTGAVFQTALPSAQLGPVGPGPAYHTGHTTASSASTVDTGFDSASVAALSMRGPPSVSSDGVGEFVDLRLSDTGTERAASTTSESTDYQVARGLTKLGLNSRPSSSVADSHVAASFLNADGSSASQQASRNISSVTGGRSANASSSRSLTAPSDMASSFVIVEDATPAAPAQTTAAPTMTDAEVDSSYGDDSYEFEDDDFDTGDDDDDADNMQEFTDDDDSDARSDDTLMPDREEIMEAMRRDGAQV
ncbi:hypothetical protein F503_05724 [Ophiostoma piceae UAMH 11346]|uniref:Uncharacterized protein n=1 Tax=Ophiostoma piceae (strain UAMH 11346) TaxID=1262450 RepID=S3CAT2_OPHP1|nr:hypothetical protein F503_05724 [Ophiostoma piceae UAMH 11346]